MPKLLEARYKLHGANNLFSDSVRLGNPRDTHVMLVAYTLLVALKGYVYFVDSIKVSIPGLPRCRPPVTDQKISFGAFLLDRYAT